MKRSTLTLAGIAAVALSLLGTLAFAAEESAPAVPEVPDSFWDQLEEAPDNGLPDVRVNRVDLPAGPFVAGETISGVANVSNPSGRPAEASFEVGLVSLDGQGIPREVYAMDYGGGEFSLAPGETADVPFSLDVPFGISAKDVSARVGTRLVGSVYLGWNYSAPFDVVGSGGAATVESAYYTLADGSEAAHTDGPTLYAEAPRDRLPLSVTLRGLGGAVELRPVITVENRALGTSERRELDAVAEVPANGTTTIVVPFAYDGQEPGVYEGEIAWLAPDGLERAPRLGFRYIVAGQTATVHSVSSSLDAVSEGQGFRVTLSLSGAPVDLAAADRDQDGPLPATVSVEIFDAAGRVAGGSQTEVLPALGQMSFDLTASRAAASMTARVTVTDGDGEEILNRDYPLSAGETAPDPDGSARAKLAFSVAAGVAALLLLAALLSWRRARRRAALAAVLLAAAAWGFALYSSVSATGGNTILTRNIVNVGWISNCTGPNIYVNAPAPRSSVSCNSGFTAQGNVQYSYCSNTDNYGSTQLWLQRQGYGALQYGGTDSYSMGSGGGHWGAYYTGDFSMWIPGHQLSQNGNYGLGITNSAVIGNGGCSWTVSGISHFSVVGCDVCLNVDGVQSTVPSDRFKDTAGETAGNCYTVTAPVSCTVDNVRTEVGGSVTWTAAGCDDTCVWNDGSTGATHSVVATAAGDLTATVKSRKTVTGSDGNVASRESSAVTCDATVVVADVCTNEDLMPGTQSEVPAGFVPNAGGECVCPANTTYDPVDGRCEDEHGLCATCGGATCGDRVCSASESCSSCSADCGVCSGGRCGDDVCNNGENCSSCPGDCGVCVAACPIESASQYCAEIYDRNGDRTGAFPSSLTADDLERAFGYKLPDAVRDLLAAVDLGAPTDPIWVAVGRGAGSADYASAGCAGAMCTYGGNGCLTTIDPQTNLSVARCSPINDIDGDAGLPPTALLEIEPSVVGTNGKCSILWSSHEMLSCRVTGLGLDSTLLAGKASTPALQNSATYVLGCTGLDGRAYSDSDTCVVSPDVVEF